MFRWLVRTHGDDPSLQRNLFANIMDGAFFALGMSFVSQQTILPVYLKRIGGGNIAVGLIPVLWTAGFNFPQIFGAGYALGYSRKKDIFTKTAFVQRLPWFLMAALSYFVIDSIEPSIGVPLFLAVFMLAAVAGSINLPIWFDLITKLTPVDLRGRLFAARNLAGGILGIAGGWTAEWMLATITYPSNFALLFLLAVSAMMVSYLFLLLLKEERALAPNAHTEFPEYVRKLPDILRHHRNFRNFLISDALLIAATMGGAFYAVHAIEKFSLPDSYAGFFTVVIMVSTIAGNLFFGQLADLYGHKLNLMLSAASTVAACLLALLASSPLVYLMVFVGFASTVGLSGISRLSIVAELCPEGERATYVALANMVTSPFVLFGVLAGWIANHFGYEPVFVIAGFLALASGLWLALRVQEPRGRSRAISDSEGTGANARRYLAT